MSRLISGTKVKLKIINHHDLMIKAKPWFLLFLKNNHCSCVMVSQAGLFLSLLPLIHLLGFQKVFDGGDEVLELNHWLIGGTLVHWPYVTLSWCQSDHEKKRHLHLTLTKEGKELADRWADCLYFVLLVVMMEGEMSEEQQQEKKTGGGSPRLWWSSEVDGKAGGLDGFAAVVCWLGLMLLNAAPWDLLEGQNTWVPLILFGMGSKVAS